VRIVSGKSQASDLDRLDHLASDCEALTKELMAARNRLAKSEKDKHQVKQRSTSIQQSPSACWPQ
jgi:hypothetical protein